MHFLDANTGVTFQWLTPAEEKAAHCVHSSIDLFFWFSETNQKHRSSNPDFITY